MLLDDQPPSELINLTKYAALMGVTRQAVHYQLTNGICAVPPVPGYRPRKWRLADVQIEIDRRVAADTGGDQ